MCNVSKGHGAIGEWEVIDEKCTIPLATSSPVYGEKRSKVASSLAGTSLLLMSSCVSIGLCILRFTVNLAVV